MEHNHTHNHSHRHGRLKITIILNVAITIAQVIGEIIYAGAMLFKLIRCNRGVYSAFSTCPVIHEN